MNNKLVRFFSAAFLTLAGGLLTHTASAAETITYFHNDVSGTPMLATDATGNVVWKEYYSPYGDKLTGASSSNSIGYAGKPYDASTGLSYMGARYYDPLIGRFTGVDPKGVELHHPLTQYLHFSMTQISSHKPMI